MHVHNIAAIKEHAKRTLTPVREPAHTFAGGIQFAMMDGPRRVIRWVTGEGLDRLKRHSRCQGDPVDLAMVNPAKRHRELVADFAAERTKLR